MTDRKEQRHAEATHVEATDSGCPGCGEGETSTCLQTPPCDDCCYCSKRLRRESVQPIEESSLVMPAEWNVQHVKMNVETTRVWVPLSETTAMLLAAVLERRGMSAESWIADKAIVDASEAAPAQQEQP